MKKTSLFILSFVMITFFELNAQHLIREAPLEKQIENSSLIVEGKVVSKTSYWDSDNTNIYTVNTIEVYKVFKGESVQLIDIVTKGGVVGLKAEIVTPSLKLTSGDTGVFMLYDNSISINRASAKKQFKTYGTTQGFFKYNFKKDIVTNPFSKKSGIVTSFYREIMSHTKLSYVEIKSFNVQEKISNSISLKSAKPPTGITFSPTTVSAGTKTLLTINGSGFGGAQGKVGFSNADDGGASFFEALDSQVISWSDTQIIVEVPSDAGTGPIEVTDSGDVSATSNADLTITYSEINISSDAINTGTFIAYNTRHINRDSQGGYTWQMFTDFDANADAKAAFLRAFEIWRCDSGINWTIGATTNVDVSANDDINIVRFDNGAELDSQTLGLCTSRYAGCLVSGGTDIDWYVEELDIVFNDNVDLAQTPGTTEVWNYGTDEPTNSEYDFESVVLHELGHGHQLAHVINSNSDVMHFNLTNGESQRILSNNNKTAAANVQNRSVNGMVCSQLAMINYSGSCGGLSIDENELDEIVSIFPNPTTGSFKIDASHIELEKVMIYDISGRQISIHDLTKDSSRIKTINMNASSGVYFMNIYSENTMITKKIVIE